MTDQGSNIPETTPQDPTGPQDTPGVDPAVPDEDSDPQSNIGGPVADPLEGHLGEGLGITPEHLAAGIDIGALQREHGNPADFVTPADEQAE